MSLPAHRPTVSSAVSLLLLFAFTWGGTARAFSSVGGTNDNFAMPTEPVTPSAGLLTWLGLNYPDPTPRPYDDTSRNHYFVTTFSKLKSQGNICGATLWMRIYNGDSNDEIALGFIGDDGQPVANGWASPLPNVGVPLNATATVVLNLAALPGGYNLLPTLNALGYLDVLVQDDSGVDAAVLTITPCRTDVYIRDSASDTGAEPGSTSFFWASPDIRVCNTPFCVGNQNPEVGQTNYINVKLNNPGPNAPGATAFGTVTVHYVAAGNPMQWGTSDWTLINTATVYVPVNTGSFEVPIQWNNLPPPGHYILLARWVSNTDTMTFAEGADAVLNTTQNNNIAWRSVSVLDVTP